MQLGKFHCCIYPSYHEVSSNMVDVLYGAGGPRPACRAFEWKERRMAHKWELLELLPISHHPPVLS